MRSFVKAVESEDYLEIGQGVGHVQSMTSTFQLCGCRIEIPHQHRWWEYGSAVQLFADQYQAQACEKRVLDVGAGWGALGPTLAMVCAAQVVEVETDAQCVADREKINAVIRTKYQRPEMVIKHTGIGMLPQEEFDAVFCISVMEHLEPELEYRSWGYLASRVKKNGLLFVTMDVVPGPGRFHFDELRRTNYTMADLKERIERVCAMGFVPLGQPDYEWKGALVFDYSFYRMGFIKQ
jgi:hypothetical protein